ncbi:MAG TPA: hypothetical protein VH113_02465, partial [Gemmatimonadales bacterium]|nr:hypothetical protein [Gemmatimonadales bacterium]
LPNPPFFNLNAFVLDSVGDTLTDRVVNWTVGDTTIALLNSPTGPGVAIIGRKAGLAVVIATVSGHADTARILVIRPTIRTIALSPDTGTLVVPNASVGITATPKDSLNQPLNDRIVHWLSLDTAVATVSDTTGLSVTLTGKISGTARVVAASEGVTDTATFHVVVPTVSRVVFVNPGGSPPPDTTPLLFHTSRQLGAVPQDSNGTPLSRVVTFSSSDSTVLLPQSQAFVSDITFFIVTGNAVGSSTLSATAGAATATWHSSVYSVAYSAVSAANDEGCALAGGALYCWRNNGYPHAIAKASGIVSISSDGTHGCGLDGTGAAKCWGDNGAGQLGSFGASSYDTAVAVLGGGLYSQIDAGLQHTCAATAAGAAWCWGNNTQGQVGSDDSTNFEINQPTAVAGGLVFSSVSAGGNHSCGLTNAGAAYCWGLNSNGQLGNGGVGAIVRHPVPVSGGLTFASISAGYTHSCALTAAGVAYCWGDNSDGALGTGDTSAHNTPIPVSGGLTFTAIAAGWSFTCGIATGGTVYCWGRNSQGSLGNGTSNPSHSPTPITGALTFQTITAGGGSQASCGMTTGGVAYCWGTGAIGIPLGYSLTPVKVPGQP